MKNTNTYKTGVCLRLLISTISRRSLTILLAFN